VELARAIRGKSVEQAREYLEKVVALEQPVPMKTYKRWVEPTLGKLWLLPINVRRMLL